MLGALLVWVAYHLPAIAEKDASDQHIDEILRAFFEKWEAEDRGVGRFQSMMVDIGHLFDGIDSMELKSRFKDRMKVITKTPKQEDHPEHVYGAKSKTEV